MGKPNMTRAAEKPSADGLKSQKASAPPVESPAPSEPPPAPSPAPPNDDGPPPGKADVAAPVMGALMATSGATTEAASSMTTRVQRSLSSPAPPSPAERAPPPTGADGVATPPKPASATPREVAPPTMEATVPTPAMVTLPLPTNATAPPSAAVPPALPTSTAFAGPVMAATAMATMSRLPQSALALTSPPTYAELVEEWLKGKSITTLIAYRRDLKGFALFAGVATLDDAAKLLLSGGHAGANRIVLAYKNALLQQPIKLKDTANPNPRPLASATVARRLAALRSLVHLARTLGLIDWSIDIRAPKVERVRDTRGPGRQAVRAMKATLDQREGRKAVRDRAILRLLHDRALRRAELVSLDLENLDVARGEIAIMGKGRRVREVLTIPDQTKAALAAWLAVRGTEPGPLFLSLDPARKGSGRLSTSGVYRLIRRLGEDVGARARPHGLRHTAAVTALDETKGDLRAVASYGRWANLRTLLDYDDARRDVGGLTARKVADALDEPPQSSSA